MRPLTLSERVRQYDVFSAQLTGELPPLVDTHNYELHAAANRLARQHSCVQLYLPWQTPLDLTMPRAPITSWQLNIDLARKYHCRTITSMVVVSEAERLRSLGLYPVGNFAEFAFSEFSLALLERSRPALAFEGGELALSLSCESCIESARRERLNTITYANREFERRWFSSLERLELEAQLLEIAKHSVESQTTVRLLEPEFRYDTNSDSLFYAGEVMPEIAESIVLQLIARRAFQAFVLQPFTHPAVTVRQLARTDFAAIQRGFETKQLDAPVWEVRLVRSSSNPPVW